MTFLAAAASGFPKQRVMGMAGVLDSARLRYFIAEELGVSPTCVEAITLGSHGDAMVALPRHATVNGTPLPELVDEPTLDRLFQRTRDGGAEIVALLKKGSAYYAPSASIAQMVAAIANDSQRCFRSARGRRAQYGIADVYVGVPAKSRSRGRGRDRRARPERRRAGERCGQRPRASARNARTWTRSSSRTGCPGRSWRRARDALLTHPRQVHHAAGHGEQRDR